MAESGKGIGMLSRWILVLLFVQLVISGGCGSGGGGSDNSTHSEDDGIGGTPEESALIATVVAPKADTTITVGQSIVFQGTTSGGEGKIAYLWTFGGAAENSTEKVPGTLTFNTPGTFAVTFTATDERGSVSSNAVTITVMSRGIPIATITSPASDTVIAAGETIFFEGAESGGNGDITYAWSFGGGSLDSAARNPGAVDFDVPGSYTVTFTATDADGDSSRDTVTVTVQGSDSEPVARIVSPVSDMCILVGQAVTFQGAVTGGDGGMAFTWNFGGAAPNSSEQNPGSVMFSATGKYVVVFTARDEDGDTSSDSVMVTVEEDTTPVAMITSPASDAIVDAGQTVLFQGAVSGGNGSMSYRWSFDGGAEESRFRDPGLVRFTNAGIYTVTFSVTDSDGDRGIDVVIITVTPASNAWASLAAGFNYSAALKTEGSLWAWGANTGGQLGDGTTTDRTIPARIGNSAAWEIISTGYFHSLALKRDGTLWVWGENENGQLGDGMHIDQTIPEQIGTDTDWTSVDAGYFHSVALKTDGSLWAWGYNLKGQLGDGTTVDKSIPTRVGGDSDWVAVSGGAYHTVALKRNGSLWSWGYNSSGQLGDGTQEDKLTPVRVGVDTDWIAASAGFYHTVAVKRDGSLWAWGYNNSGQLGDGTHTSRTNPTMIGNDTTWAAMSAGCHHTVALKVDGSLWAWGYNSSGQLGDGTTIDRLSPARIGDMFDWLMIAAGAYHTLAVKRDGTSWGWGSNQSGQLGDGTKNDRHSPILIVGN